MKFSFVIQSEAKDLVYIKRGCLRDFSPLAQQLVFVAKAPLNDNGNVNINSL